MATINPYDREAPEGSYYLHTRDEVPLKTEFKPAVKVLSRKPASKKEMYIDPITGLEKLTVDDDDDDEEDDTKKKPLTMEERQSKAQQEREEKQKKYEEARHRLFGTNHNPITKSGTTTPPTVKSNGESRNSSRNKSSKESRPTSSAGNKNRQLYDPNCTGKTESIYVQKKDTPTGSGRSTPLEQQPIRSPRGPETSGRGGFGFAPRGGRAA